MYFAISNLRSTTAFQTDPKTYTPNYPAFASKSAFRMWCGDANTKHAFISGVEGLNPAERINADNPACKIHALVLDYDAPVSWGTLEADLEKRCKGTPKPTWAVATWSGHLRLVWELAAPAIVNEFTAGGVLEHLAKLVQCTKLHAGYDKTSVNPSQYFDIGTKWTPLGGGITADDVLTAVFKTGLGKTTVTDVSVPLESVAVELEKRFPNRWKGDFVEGARGPLFWIQDGIDRDGAVVKQEGMLCYSDRAGAPFISWREIFGNEFIQQYETRRLVDGVSDIWYDGRDFWIFGPQGPVRNIRDNVILHLKMAGFSYDKKKGQKVSDVESALHYIITNNRVDGAGPFVFRSDKIVVDSDGRRYVNTSRCKAITPADSGDPVHWPWLNDFFSRLFDPVADELGAMPLDFWYAWLSRAYKASYYKQQLSGHAVIIVGVAGRGKTLLSQFIMGELMGGAEDASEFLSAKTNFNKSLSEAPVWAVDDTVSATNFADHRKFVEMLKRLVANPRVAVEAKYADRVSIPWFGRIIITLNEDPNSLSMIPNLESSNRDKLMAFRISDTARHEFLANDKQEALIRKELPHFAKWLLEYDPSIAVAGNARYGVRSYFHPLIENSARDSSTRQGSTELLDIFFKYFKESNPKIEYWTGTTTELLVEMNKVEELRTFPLLKDPMRLQRDLSSAEEYSKANPTLRSLTSVSTGSGRIWTISTQNKHE